MLTLIRADEHSPYLSQITALYRRSFPPNERMPLRGMLADQSGAGEVLAALDGDIFIGMAVLLTWQDITHILYFAVEETHRDKGYGSRILREVQSRYPKHRIIADVEEPFPGADNVEQRERRIAFYRKNGYELTEVRYRWAGERYLILAAGGSVSEDEFWDFWDSFYK